MADVTLSVKVEKQGVDNLEKQVNSINQKGLKLTISGATPKVLENYSAQIKKLVNETIEEAAADRKLKQAKEEASKARAKAREETAKAAQATVKARADEAKANAQTVAEEQKTARAKEQTTRATINLEKEKVKASQASTREAEAAAKVATAQARETAELEKTKRALLEHEEQMNKATKANDNFMLSLLKARAISFVVQTITSGFRDALNTIREVDKELATIQKVTGFTEEQMQPISQAAYSNASKYGVEATQYLQSVAEFARAGYKEVSDELGELAIKTQLVGDTNAETADKFLLAVDAAWKMEGSVSQLSTVLDKANIIENNYATTIDKIAAGMPNVASVAAMTNVSVDETIAALGTITAVTQQTGQKASTALRSLFLNIVGDTNTAFETETGEFVKWTSDEVEVLRGLLNKYAKDVVDQAKAAGEVINPMRAIEALAEAFERGDLKANELEATLQKIGGKLRTNQLVALVENFDMVNEMLTLMGASAGSADKEIGIMLDTWDAKAKILKNTWTEFVSKSASTDAIKGFLDVLTNILKTVGSLGNAIAIVAAIVTAIKLPTIINLVTTLGTKITNLTSYLKAAYAIYKAFNEQGNIFGFLKESLTGVQKAQIAIIAVTAAVVALTAAYKAYYKNIENASASLQKQSETSLTEYQNTDSLRKKLIEAEDQYKANAITKEQYEAVTERVAKALGIEADQVENLRTELERLTEQEREEALQDAQRAQQGIAAEISGMNGNKFLQPFLRDAGFFEAKDVAGKMAAAERARELLSGANAFYSQNVVEGNNSLLNKSNLDKSAKALEWLDEQLEEYARQEEILAILNGETTETTDAQAESFGELSDNITEAKDALEEFTSATEAELDDKFQKYVSAYKQFLEDWEAGLKGSNAVKAAEELFFTDEQINELRAKGMDVGEILANDFYKGIFSAEGKDRGAVFLGQLWDIFGGDIVSNGKLAASLSKTGDSINFVVEDVDALADALYNLTGLGFTPEFLESWLGALGMYSSDINMSANALLEMAAGFDAVSSSGAVNLEAYLQGLIGLFGDNTNAIWDYIDALLEAADKGDIEVDLGADSVQAARDKVRDALNDVKQGEEDVTNQETTVEINVEGYSEAVSLLDSLRLETAQPIVQQIVFATRAAHNANGTRNFAGGLSVVNERGPELIAEDNTLRIAGNGQPTLTYLSPGSQVLTAGQTRSALGGVDPSMFYGGISLFASGKTKIGSGSGSGSGSTTINSMISSAVKAMQKTASTAKAIVSTSSAQSYSVPVSSTSASAYGSGGSSSGSSGGSSGGGGGSSSSSKSDATLDKLKEIVNLRKSELDLIKAQGGTTKSQIDKQREIQQALKNEINYLVSIGGNQTEINKLWTEWYKINDDIKKLIEDMFDELSKAADRQIDALEKERDKALEPLDAQLKAMQEQRDAAQDQLDYEEKLLAVEQARQALENAKGERNVRYWNAAKGQWEWTYNAQNVASAQKSYDDALKALADYEDQMAYDAAVKEIEAQKQAITDSYKAATDGWQEVIDALKEPTDDMETVLKRISESSMPEMEDTINTLNVLLARFGYAIGGYGGAYLNSSMVPTSITDAMISPVSGSLAGSVGNVAYGATPYGFAGTTGTSIGTQYNGGVYNIGGVSLTEAQAKSTTVYELAMLSRNLKAYNATC